MPEQVRIRENSWMARAASCYMSSHQLAIVIGNTIHLWGTTKENFSNDKKWLKHELKHVEQFENFGLLRFAVMYLFEWLKHGYHKNRFEVEARQAEETD